MRASTKFLAGMILPVSSPPVYRVAGKMQKQEKVIADDDLKLKACETKNKAKEVIVESQKVEIQKKQDEITQLEAELKSLKDRFAKEVGTNEALKTRVNAAEGKSANLENEIEKAKNLKN